MSLVVLALTGALVAASPGGAAQGGAAADNDLSSFGGHWTCAGHFEPSGKPIASILDFTWEESSAALIVHHRDMQGGDYSSVELWSPPAGKLGWRAVIADSYSGMRRFVSEGWRGAALTWTRDDAGASPERFTYSLDSGDALEVTWEIGKSVDSMHVGDRLACAKTSTAGHG